jgi:hypothetical protein
MWAKSRGDVKTAFAAATPEMQQAVRESYFSLFRNVLGVFH